MSFFYDRPLFVWFGLAAGIFMTAAVFLGFNMRRFGIKKHKAFALLAFLFAILHFIFGAWRYF
ncbi:MAG: hypothetical protein GX447_08860 [Elusimicrobia bacterium]|nr:hypothetical protein [Elusimicrobiota bacterium]